MPLLLTGSREGLPGEVFAEWVGDQAIPAWWEIRTRRFAYIELGTGSASSTRYGTIPTSS